MTLRSRPQECHHCGGQLRKFSRRYCTAACRKEHARILRVRHRACPQCGIIHTGPLRKFCSETCADVFAKAKRRATITTRPLKMVRCGTCQMWFESAPHGLHLYCSDACQPSMIRRKQNWSQEYRVRRQRRLMKTLQKHGIAS